MSSTEELLKRIETLEKTLKEEREEYREYYNRCKNNTNDEVYVDKDYYKESQYIETLKKQINVLINQNMYLKDVNNKLIREN